MRILCVALLLAAALLGAVPTAALASCVRETTADQAARAQVVAVGVVTGTRQTFVAAGGVIQFRPERVLKGTLTGEVQVYLGPSHGGAITSVDYTAVVRGERHTLYLRATTDGSYETDSCSGSHAGDATATEESTLGKGTRVADANDVASSPALAASLITLSLLALVAIALGVRRSRRT